MAQPQLHLAAKPAPLTRTIGGIGALAAEISEACSDPSAIEAERIKAALRRAVATPGLLGAEQRVAKADCYARHVIYADPSGRFTILAIVWGTGQFSAPHAHHTWCAYGVYENALDETIFSWDAATSTAHPLRTYGREPGYSCYAGPGLDQIHRLGNSGATPAISIHVYGVERDSIGTHVNRTVETTTAAQVRQRGPG
jgi:predicted metal-dependent enzyme (double-stranded beta helix superfamily)